MGASSRRVLGQIRRRLLAKRSRCCWKPPPARSRRASSGAGLRLGWSAGKKFRSATRRIGTSACRVVRPMIPACSGRQAWKNAARSQRTYCPVFPGGAGGRCVDVVRIMSRRDDCALSMLSTYFSVAYTPRGSPRMSAEVFHGTSPTAIGCSRRALARHLCCNNAHNRIPGLACRTSRAPR